MSHTKNKPEGDLSAILQAGHRVRAEILHELEESEPEDSASSSSLLRESAKILRLARALEQAQRREHVAMEKEWKSLLKARKALAERDRDSALIRLIHNVTKLTGPDFVRAFIALRAQLLTSPQSGDGTPMTGR